MRGAVGVLLVVLVVSTFTEIRATSKTVEAASCNAADVQAALNDAEEGDTVSIPAGECHWRTQVRWTAPPNVTVLGAGDLTVRGGGDRTVIVDDFADDTFLLGITTNASGSFRLAGITFKGGTGMIKYNRIIQIGGRSKQVRLDHITIDGSSYSTGTARQSGALRFVNWVNGVVDESIITAFQGVDVWMDAHSGGRYGDGAWAEPTKLGSSDFVFIEDIEFNSLGGSITDCSNGGRFVLRESRGRQTMMHPTGGMGRMRGCRAWEIYKNRFVNGSSTTNHNAVWISSGTGVVWGNSTEGRYKHFMTLHSMRKTDATYKQSAPPNGWGYCGTSFNGTGSSWDGNENAASGYPCLDQPGRGQGDLLVNPFPNTRNSATQCSGSSPCAWPRQALEPVYAWANGWQLVQNSGGSFAAAAEFSVLSANKDYYVEIQPFTGSSGIGVGKLSDRPSSCTPGVAYWATNMPGRWPETLYQCSAPNTWTEYYRPYPYPHPLRSGAPASLVGAPGNLRVTVH